MQFLGRYEVISQLGQGNKDMVYKVRHPVLNIIYTIKVLSAYPTKNPDLVSRFFREALIMARLEHPNIAHVLDVQQDEVLGVLCILMEYIEGQTLKEYIREKGALSESEVLKITKQVAGALAYCHRFDPAVIHREINPTNIMIEEGTQRVVVIGFGIAKELEENELINAGALETFKYYPPEQICNEALDGSTDVYALGMVMYEIYTGAHLFKGLNEGDLIRKVLESEEYEIPLPPKTSPNFASTLSKAIKKDRSLRYRCMEDLINDLENYEMCGSPPKGMGHVGSFISDALKRIFAEKRPNTKIGSNTAKPVDTVRDRSSRGRPSLFSKLSGLFSNLLNKPESDQTQTDEVHLAISAPRFVKPESGFVARFAAYVPECEGEVRQKIKTAERSSAEFIPQPETCRWQFGAPIRVRVIGDCFTSVPDEQTFKWNGRWVIKSFQVLPKAEAPLGSAQLGFEVWVANFPEAWLWVELEISTDFELSDELAETTGRPMRRAFASYASADRPDVLARISAITAWDKGLDIFYDWLDLTEGEDWEVRLKKELSLREVLLLFWSQNAKASKWVDWEWRTMLRTKGLKAIQPMPIEPPEIAAPPDELAPHMNFRDRYLIAREAALRIVECKTETKKN